MTDDLIGTGPRAAERVARTITIVAAAAAALLGGTAIGGMLDAAPFLAPWYTPAAVTIIFGGFTIAAVYSFFVPLPRIRRAYGAYAVVFVIVQLAWLPAQTHSTPLTLNPWVLEMATIGTVPAAIAWRAWIAWAYLILNAVVVGVVRFISAGSADISEPLQYALLTISIGAIFTALTLVAMRNAAIVDAATAELRDQAARAAAATARAREQARLDALVHDEVMSTLFYASRADGALLESVQAQARGALAQLESLRRGRPERSGEVDASGFVSRIRSVVLDASVAIDFEHHGTRSRAIPGDIAEAFAEATSEAARNSLTHAPEARHRSVNVVLTEAGIDVIVHDDGRGFDPRDVAPHRLGIPVSIRGRLTALPGGRASVSSRPGNGTVVALGWSDS